MHLTIPFTSKFKKGYKVENTYLFKTEGVLDENVCVKDMLLCRKFEYGLFRTKYPKVSENSKIGYLRQNTPLYQEIRKLSASSIQLVIEKSFDVLFSLIFFGSVDRPIITR